MPVDQFLQNTTDRFRIDMAINMDHPTLAGIFIEYGQHFETPTAVRLIVNKIPSPNMAGMFGPGRQPGGDPPASASWLSG